MSLAPPEPGLRASVVVPAKDEEDLVGRCLESLASQTGVTSEEYEVLLVLDDCRDATAEKAVSVVSDHPGLRLHTLNGPGLGAGHARWVGMEAACSRLFSLGRPGALIASTDADTVVAPDWLGTQLSAAECGARAIGGRIELLEEGEEDGPPEGVRSWREHRGETRHLELLDREKRGSGPRIEHWQFSGASMSLTAEAYREVGGMEPRAALEDEYLERALERCGIQIQRPLDVRVSTSPRLVGRASRGLAKDLSLASWLEVNTYRNSHEPLESWEAWPHAEGTVSVVAPAAEEEEPPVLPEGFDLIPVSPDSGDAPMTVGFGPVLGRGDAWWRGLSRAAEGPVVLLPDLSAGSLAAVPTLLAPLLEREELDLVKGYPASGAVSEMSRLVGKPLINLYHPELAGLVDPLSPLMAVRRSLLASLPFPVGDGVDASLPLDAARARGVWSVAQVPLGSLPVVTGTTPEDSCATMAAILSRTRTGEPAPPSPFIVPDPGGMGFDTRRVQAEERPPLDKLAEPAAEPALDCRSER